MISIKDLLNPSLRYDLEDLNKLSREILVSKTVLERKKYYQLLESYVEKKIDKYQQVLDIAKNQYSLITSNYRLDTVSKTFKTIKAPHFEIAEEDLMKIVRKSVLQLNKTREIKAKCIVINIQEPYFSFYVNKNLNIIQDAKVVLGEGKTTIINKVKFISRGIFAAVKLATTVSSIERITNEYLKLQWVSNLNPGKGIQKTCNAYTKIKDESGTYQPLFLTPVSNIGSLLDFMDIQLEKNASIQLKKNFVNQLIKGISFLHDKGIVHGDIKEDNILVNKFKSKYEVTLADFEGSIFPPYKEPKLYKGILGTSHTPGYYAYKDLTELSNAKKENNIEKWIQLNKARDMFAFGKTIWSLFVDTNPFEENEKKLPLFCMPMISLDKIKEILSPQEVEALLQILQENPLERLSAHDFYERFFGEKGSNEAQ